VEEFSVLKR